MAKSTIKMQLKEKNGQIYTEIRLSKGVGFPIRDTLELLCRNSQDNEYIKESKLYDYFLIKGDLLNKSKHQQ